MFLPGNIEVSLIEDIGFLLRICIAQIKRKWLSFFNIPPNI